MPEITPSQLVTINLKFGGHARPLKALAFADLAANALFFLNHEATVQEVAAEVARLLSRPRIDQNLVTDGLNTLQTDQKARQTGGRWRLVDDARQAMADESRATEDALDIVLTRHFPGAIDREVLRRWFRDASSDFFGFNSEECLKSISRNLTTNFARPQTVRELLMRSIQAAGLRDHEDALVDSYCAFLSSREAADQRCIMNLGFAMFSARLVAADIGADPIAVDEIRGATFVLDTNTIFAMQLESRTLAQSINALGLALAEIGADLVFLDSTRQEYLRVLVGKRGEIAALFREFPDQVVLDSKSDFIESGIARGCSNAEDFEGFFDTIRTPPTQLPSGMPIVMRDDPEIEEEKNRAEADTRLQAAIQRHYVRLRSRRFPWMRKSERALVHDAVLVKVVEAMRREKPRTWILSFDRTLQACAIERAGTNAMPVVFMLDGLIQILAVQSGGPRHRAEDFAPLLTSIILNRCSPSERTYTPQDLQWLHTIQQRVVDFPPEKIKQIASIVTRHRLAGAEANNNALVLAVNRAYQEERQEYDQQLEAERERARGAESDARSARAELKTTRGDLARLKYSDCVRTARKKLVWALSWRIPTALVVVAIVFILAWLAYPSQTSGLLGWIASIIVFGGILSWLSWKPVINYRAAILTCKE